MSRFPLGNGVMGFGGDDAEFQKVADRVEQRTKNMVRELNIGGQKIGITNPAWLKALEDQMGGVERATGKVSKSVNDVGDSLIKIGRYSIFTRLADGLRSMAQEAEKFTIEIAKGNASVNDLIEAMAKKIPFGVGALVEVGRDLHGLLSGDTLAVAQSQADTAAADKKIDFQKRLALAVREVGRAGEDAQQKLNFTVDKSPFFNSLQTFLKTGERAAEDLRTKLGENQNLLSEGGKRREQLLRDLDAAKLQGDIVHSDDPLNPTVIIPSSGAIAEKQQAIDRLDASLQQYRDTIGRINGLLKEDTGTAGRPTFTAIFNLVGAEAEKGLSQASKAIDRFIGRVPQLTSETSRALSDLGGKFLALQTQLNGFSADFAKGLIPENVLDKLNFNAISKAAGADFWKSLGSAISDRFGDFQAAVDPKIGGFISNLREQMRNVLADFGIGTSPKAAAAAQLPSPFRASLVGLEDLGRRIQQSAAGGRDETQDGILEAARATAKATADTAKYLKNQAGPIGP